MLPIALSVLLSSQSHLLFKVFERLRVDVFHAVLANYVVCVIVGALLCRVGPAIPPVFQLPWFPLAAVVGVLLIASFCLTGLAVQRIGATAASVASKLSVVVPVTYSLVAYQERSDPPKLIGIGLALLAVVLTTRREEAGSHRQPLRAGLLLLGLFLCSGLLDALTKRAQAVLASAAEFDCFLRVAFMCALAIGLGFLAFQVLVRAHVPSRRSLAAGLVLGCSNYAATHCLMRALESSGLESSVLFPANNVLTLGVTAVAASVVFGERLSAGNVTGLGIAGASLCVMALR